MKYLLTIFLVYPIFFYSQSINRPAEMAALQHRVDNVRRLDSIDHRPLNDIDYSKVNREEWEKIVVELEQIQKKDQSHRSPKMSNSEYAKQHKIDSTSTLRIIQIINLYGYPNSKRVNKRVSVTLILFHVPQIFHSLLSKTIVDECIKANISREENELLQWHFRGRPGKMSFSIE